MISARLGCVCLLTGLLVGCGTSHDDLHDYVARIKNRSAQAIAPLPDVVDYEPFIYQPRDRRGPFTPTRRLPSSRPSHSMVAPDTQRSREALERFPLDSLHMVGTIRSDGVTYALISAPDQVLHRVKQGDHLGQNFGQIQSVSDNGITITEIVPDGADGYTKRGAALAPSG